LLITKLRKVYCRASVKIFKISEYLAKLQARTWLSHTLCAPDHHTAKKRNSRRSWPRGRSFRIASYLPRVASFNYPTFICRPCDSGGISRRSDLWHQKTRLNGLLCGTVSMILRLSVLVELQLVTDRRTDGHRSIAYTAIA